MASRDSIEQALAGLSPAEITRIAQQLVATGAPVEELVAATRPASRRRTRRDEPVTLRVRVDLAHTKPPVWRRLELASDLFLDEVHEVVQAAFGWDDSHLHRFGSGPSYYSHETEYYLDPFSADDGVEGIPEEEVRLDEVLVDVGDKLFYAYDFGDDWQHVIKLEKVLPLVESAPRAICTGGRRPAPADDCGGVGMFELLVVANDPAHPDHAAAVAEHQRIYGGEIDAENWAPTPFDIDLINARLAGSPVEEVDGPLGELLDRLRTADAQYQLRELLDDARLDEPMLVDAAMVAAAMEQFTWLLNRVGNDGIKLTAAGYLPPADVLAAFTELGFDGTWIGRGNREDLTYPVLHLRHSAQQAGLLRKYRGRLLATAKGKALREDPVGLWWHLAERTPAGTGIAQDAGLLYLAALAGGAERPHAVVADLLSALGWTHSDDSPITVRSAVSATEGLTDLLRILNLLQRHGSGVHQAEAPTGNAATFARSALTTWPR